MEQRAHARLLAWAGGDIEQPYAHVAVGWPDHRHLKARVLVRMGERAPPGSRGAAWVAKALMDTIEDLTRGFSLDRCRLDPEQLARSGVAVAHVKLVVHDQQSVGHAGDDGR